MRNRLLFRTSICFALFVLVTSHVFAMPSDGIVPKLLEIPIDEELDLQITTTPTEETNFHQMSVANDGSFALLIRAVDPKKPDEYRVHIDVYDETGTFRTGFSSSTHSGITLEYTGRYANVYLYNTMVAYDIENKSFSSYQISDNAIIKDGYAELLCQSEVKCGEWIYRAKEGVTGYTELTRTDGMLTELLVQYPGTNDSPLDIIFDLFGSMILFVLIPCLLHRQIKGKRSR